MANGCLVDPKIGGYNSGTHILAIHSSCSKVTKIQVCRIVLVINSRTTRDVVESQNAIAH